MSVWFSSLYWEILLFVSSTSMLLARLKTKIKSEWWSLVSKLRTNVFYFLQIIVVILQCSKIILSLVITNNNQLVAHFDHVTYSLSILRLMVFSRSKALSSHVCCTKLDRRNGVRQTGQATTVWLIKMRFIHVSQLVTRTISSLYLWLRKIRTSDDCKLIATASGLGSSRTRNCGDFSKQIVPEEKRTSDKQIGHFESIPSCCMMPLPLPAQNSRKSLSKRRLDSPLGWRFFLLLLFCASWESGIVNSYDLRVKIVYVQPPVARRKRNV